VERRKLAIILTVIIAAAAITIAFLAFVGRGEPGASPSLSESPSATPSASASASASPSPSASASASPSEPAGPIEVAWERAEGLEPEANVLAVSFADGRWIALGQVNPEAAIWTSDDGRTWTRAEIESTRAENEVTAVTDMAELDGRLVAIGAFGLMNSDQSAWMTWTSDDGGATWTERRDGPPTQALTAIVAGGPGLVGAGSNYVGTTPYDSWIAVSADGATWELTEAIFPTSQILSLAVIDERIVAVGSVFEGSSELVPAAWYSDDGGATWESGQVPGQVPGAGRTEFVSEVVATDDGLAAIGGGNEGAKAWVSADGATWERVDIVDGVEARALALVDGGLVAVGIVGQDDAPALSWTSLDGRTWEAGVPLDDGPVQMLAADGDGTTVVAGGRCLGSCETVLFVGEVTR
jgi:hypothetical protein